MLKVPAGRYGLGPRGGTFFVSSASLFFVVLAGAGCTQEKPASEFMPDMYESTSFKAQKEDPFSKDGSANRTPPDGTIPRDFAHYKYAIDQGDLAGKELTNPVARTKANMERGQKVYNTYCIVCHGPKGDGQGFIVPPYPRPPALLSDKVRGWSDGRIFHVISRGQNLMPSYAVQIEPYDRWSVIHYIRALQRAAQPLSEDLPSSAKETGK